MRKAGRYSQLTAYKIDYKASIRNGCDAVGQTIYAHKRVVMPNHVLKAYGCHATVPKFASPETFKVKLAFLLLL